MSRPNWSVPRTWSSPGGTIIEAKSFSSGSNGAIQSAQMPATANSTTMTRPIVPSGLRRTKLIARPSSVCWRSNASVSSSTGAVVGVMTAIGHSRIADARVEPGVEHVDHEIGDHEHQDDQHHQRLGQHVVLVLHRLDQQAADAVQVEHLLGHDETADQEGELDADESDHRQQCVLERVAVDHDLLEQPLGA